MFFYKIVEILKMFSKNNPIEYDVSPVSTSNLINIPENMCP